MAAHHKRPALRFTGFHEDWEERTLNEMLTESQIRGNSGDVAKKLTIKLWGKGVVEKKGTSGSRYTQYYIRRAGQFLYSKLDFLNAAFAVLPQELDGYETTADLPAFDTIGIDPYFLFYKAIQKNFYLKKGAIADGSRKAKRVHSNTFLNMTIKKPDMEEQKKISHFILSIDNIIYKQEKIYTSLVNLKDAMLEKMFPPKGAAVPEIRFAGFSAPWERRDFGDIFTFLSHTPFTRDELNYQKGTVKCIHYGDILISFGNIFSPQKDIAPYINTPSKISTKTNYLTDGDIVFADAAEDTMAGKCIELSEMEGEHIISGLHTIPCRPQYSFSPFFLGYFLNSPSYHNQLLSFMQGTKVLSISKTALHCTSIYFPEQKAEQQKIGNFFRHLDARIKQQEQKISLWKHLKDAFLERMFI